MVNEKINLKSIGMEEYWADEFICPYCNVKDMLYGKFCPYCGHTLENTIRDKI